MGDTSKPFETAFQSTDEFLDPPSDPSGTPTVRMPRRARAIEDLRGTCVAHFRLVDIIGSGSLRTCVVLQDEIDREITSWHRFANSRDETATSPPLSLNVLHLVASISNPTTGSPAASSRAAVAMPIRPSPMIPLGASACIGTTIAVQFQPL